MKTANTKPVKSTPAAGSALILTVVLTSLLAIIGTVFLLASRVNKASTAAISENKALNLAVETVVANISQRLISDTPGVDPNQEYQEYYDYPDDQNPWLASLEPYEFSANDYRWRQISNIESNNSWNLLAEIVDEHENITAPYQLADADGDGVADSLWIELDGITTSKGKPIYAAVRVIDNSAMLNVNTAYEFDANETRQDRIDGSSQTQINLLALSQRGSNIDAEDKLLGQRTGDEPDDLSLYERNVIWQYGVPDGNYTPFDIGDELKLRNRYILNYNRMTSRIEEFWDNVYDIGLEMPRTNRNDLINDPEYWFYRTVSGSPDPNIYNYRHISTTYNMDRVIKPDGDKMFNVNNANLNAQQLYDMLSANCIDTGLSVPARKQVEDEFAQIAANIVDYGDNDSNVSVVSANSEDFYGFERPHIYISELATNHYTAVLPDAPNSVDPFRHDRSYSIELYKRFGTEDFNDWKLVVSDEDSVVISSDSFAKTGGQYLVIIYQDPYAPLSQLVKFTDSPANGATGVARDVVLSWPSLPDANAKYSYDVYFGTDYNDVRDANVSNPLGVYKGEQSYGDIDFDPPDDTNQPLVADANYYWRVDDIYDGNVIGSTGVWSFTTWKQEPNSVARFIGSDEGIYDTGDIIQLVRDINGVDVVVDSVEVPPGLISVDDDVLSYRRDINWGSRLKRQWDPVLYVGITTLGHWNNYNSNDQNPLQPFSSGFNNVGDIGKVFKKSTYYIDETYYDKYGIDENAKEEDVRIHLDDPNVQRMFRYLTVMDPDRHGYSANETRVKGRININTAPWYVIAQLPWVSDELAQAIVAYRDKLNLAGGPDYYRGGLYDSRDIETGLNGLRAKPGFAGIGELTTVINEDASKDDYDMRYYILGDRKNQDQLRFPDLSAGDGRGLGDGILDDFEERNLIFSRISDLVTVRSDVFTAYILVRIGTDGPQKRVIAILDRSDVYSNGGKVKIRALHPVPDPR